MRIILIAIFLITSPCYGAEFLVKAKEDGSKEVGDVVVVKPNGWIWGKRECAPNYIIVKIPDMKYKDAKKYEVSLNKPKKIIRDGKEVIEYEVVEHRKYKLPKSFIGSKTKIITNKYDIEGYIVEKSFNNNTD